MCTWSGFRSGLKVSCAPLGLIRSSLTPIETTDTVYDRITKDNRYPSTRLILMVALTRMSHTSLQVTMSVIANVLGSGFMTSLWDIQ